MANFYAWEKVSVAAMLTLCLSACSAFSGRETPEALTDDATITSTIKANILADHSLKILHVNVVTMDGVVQLSGLLDSQESDAKAVKIASRVNGVKTVKDNLIIP